MVFQKDEPKSIIRYSIEIRQVLSQRPNAKFGDITRELGWDPKKHNKRLSLVLKALLKNKQISFDPIQHRYSLTDQGFEEQIKEDAWEGLRSFSKKELEEMNEALTLHFVKKGLDLKKKKELKFKIEGKFRKALKIPFKVPTEFVIPFQDSALLTALDIHHKEGGNYRVNSDTRNKIAIKSWELVAAVLDGMIKEMVSDISNEKGNIEDFKDSDLTCSLLINFNAKKGVLLRTLFNSEVYKSFLDQSHSIRDSETMQKWDIDKFYQLNSNILLESLSKLIQVTQSD
jgi:hypothetical protein